MPLTPLSLEPLQGCNHENLSASGQMRHLPQWAPPEQPWNGHPNPKTRSFFLMNSDFPERKLPAQKTIHAWIIPLDLPLPPGVKLDKILSAEEMRRAGDYVFAKDAMRFRLCRAMLRLGLAWYLRRPQGTIDLAIDGNGKPRLVEPSGLYFNVTHCEDLGVIAYTTVGEVGIDVEAVHRQVEALEIAAAHFTGSEAVMIAAAKTQREQTDLFLRLWTRKEAVLKAAGRGVARGLDTVDVSRSQTSEVRLSGAPGEMADTRWVVRDLELMEGYLGAVAAPVGDWSVLEWPVRIEDMVHRFDDASLA